MLSSAHIQRFKSCQDVTVEDLGWINLLIGRNGVGKTNFLRAIEWAARVAISGVSTGDWHAFSSEASVKLAFSVGDWDFVYSIASRTVEEDKVPTPATTEELQCRRRGEVDWFRLLRRDGKQIWVKDGESATCSPTEGALTHAFLSTPDDGVKGWDLAIFLAWRFLRYAGYYPLVLDEAESPIFTGDELNKWKSAQTVTGDVLKKLVNLEKENPEAFEELKSILGSATLDIISDITVTKFPSPLGQDEIAPGTNVLYYPTFFPANYPSNRSVSYVDLSFGTRRLLSLVLSMLADKSALMLIEQPEDGIHPGLLRRLLTVLKGYTDPRQFIITSHSPAVVNVVNPADVRLVEMSNGATTIRPLSSDELVQAKHYVSSEGTLYDFVSALES